MARLLALFLALVAALVVVAPTPAVTSGPATGRIAFILDTGCFLSATTSDGTQVVAFGPAGVIDPSLRFLGGTSFADPDVGWICTGTAVFTGLPPGSTPLVLTGLTCELQPGPQAPPIPYGELATSGTAIFSANGNVRLVCPPSERT